MLDCQTPCKCINQHYLKLICTPCNLLYLLYTPCSNPLFFLREFPRLYQIYILQIRIISMLQIEGEQKQRAIKILECIMEITTMILILTKTGVIE